MTDNFRHFALQTLQENISLPISTPETPQMLTRNLHGLRKTGRIPCRSMCFTYNPPTTPWTHEQFHPRKYPGIMLYEAFSSDILDENPSTSTCSCSLGYTAHWCISWLAYRRLSVWQIPFYRIYTFSQLPLFNYILSHSTCIIANDTNHAMRCSHTCSRMLTHI